MFNHVQAYWGTLRHIEAYSSVIDGYGAIIRHVRNSALPLHIPWHIQNHGLFRTGGIFKSLPNILDEHANSELWHSQNSLFNHFQGYLGIFRDIDAYSATLTAAQLERKKFPDFGRKYPDCVFDEMFFWLRICIQTLFFLKNALS